MRYEVALPAIGYAEEGTIEEWLVNEGEYIAKGKPLLIINTEKSAIEIESPADGYLHILTDPGTTVPVRTVIGILYESRDEIGRETKDAGPSEKRVFVTPAARSLAEKEGISLDELIKNSDKKRIGTRDVEEFLSKLRKQGEVPDKKLCVESPEGIPLTPMRKTIARRLVRSLQESAQVTAITEIDVSELVKLRDRTGLKKGNGKKTSWNAIFMKAIASAVGEHPILNSQLIDEKVYVFSTVAMGFAIDLPDGLVVPVIRNVEALEIEELDKRLVECVEKARTGQLSAGDMDGGTITFSNAGMYEVDFFTPILNPPQTAIVGVGKIRPVPRVIGEGIAIRQVVYISLTYDHRVLDGAEASRFLTTLKRFLEKEHGAFGLKV